MKNLNIINIIIIILSVFMGLIFIIPIVTGALNVGNIIGIITCILIIIVNLYHHNIKLILHNILKNKFGIVALSIISFIILFSIICTIILSYFMIKATTKTPVENSTVVVLGCKVNGEKPSTMLLKRLETALDYLNKNPNAICIVSGGQGKNEGISEALAMKNYLTQNGIDLSRIYLEDKSHDTEQNIKFSASIIEENNLSKNIAIITDGFHILRASIISEKYGLTPYSVASKTPWYTFPTYYIREILALVEEIILK